MHDARVAGLTIAIATVFAAALVALASEVVRQAARTEGAGLRQAHGVRRVAGAPVVSRAGDEEKSSSKGKVSHE